MTPSSPTLLDQPALREAPLTKCITIAESVALYGSESLSDAQIIEAMLNRTSPVAPVQPSPSGRVKKAKGHGENGLPLQSFRGLIASLATLVQTRIHLGEKGPLYTHTTKHTSLLARAFEDTLLSVIPPVGEPQSSTDLMQSPCPSSISIWKGETNPRDSTLYWAISHPTPGADRIKWLPRAKPNHAPSPNSSIQRFTAELY